MATTPKPDSPADGSTTKTMSSVNARRKDSSSAFSGPAMGAFWHSGDALAWLVRRVPVVCAAARA